MKVPVFSSTIRRKEMDAVLSCMVSEKIGPGEINARLIQCVKETFGVDLETEVKIVGEDK